MKSTNQHIHDICANMGLKVDCLSSGSLSAKIAIVSDYPGETEAHTKLPFSGEAGRYLFAALARLNLKRDDLYITNVVKRCRTSKYEVISSEEISLYHEALAIELAQLTDAKYILSLGTHPLQFFGGRKDNITQWRGSVKEWEGKYVYFSNNPAYVIEKDQRTGELSEPLREVIFNLDISKFGQLLKGKYAPDKISMEVITDVRECRNLSENIIAQRRETPLCLDIEHINSNTSCIGLCYGNNTGYVIPLFDFEKNFFSLEDELEVRRIVSKLICTDGVRIIGQYVSTDLCWLWFKDRIGPIPKHVWGDTLLAHHLLYPTFPHSLAFLVSQYTWNPFYKDEGMTWKSKGSIEDYWYYNAKDTVNTYNIHATLLPVLERNKLLSFYNDHVMRLTRYLCEATVLGFNIDIDTKAELEKKFQAELDSDYKELDDIAAFYQNSETDIINVRSPKQLGNLIFDRMGAPLARRTKKGQYSTDKIKLKAIVDCRDTSEEVRDFIIKLLAVRKKEKFLSTYIKARLDDDNKFRVHYNQTGVRTAPGRLSSSQTQWGTGSNVQNQPEASRAMFVAPAGWCWVYIDGSQAEARYVGWKYRIQSWIDDFERARLNPGTFDCHRSLAAQMYNIPYDEVPYYDIDPKTGLHTIRYYGKRARHGLNYRMMPYTFAERTGLPLSQAFKIFNIYHELTPEIKLGWKADEEEIRRTKRELGYGLLVNAYGRRMVIYERLTEATTTAIVAFEPQSSVGDMLQRAWYMSEEDPDWPTGKAKIMINVHDSLTALARIEVAKDVAKIMVKHAEAPIMVRGRELIIPAEAKMSVPDEHGIHRWSNLKGIK